MEESLELYTCKPGPDSEFPGDPGFNITAPRSYNELATLMSVPGTLQSIAPHLIIKVVHQYESYSVTPCTEKARLLDPWGAQGRMLSGICCLGERTGNSGTVLW